MPIQLTTPFPVAYRTEVLADNPNLYMRVGETSGPAVDLMGNYSGTYLGTPTRGAPSLTRYNEGDLSFRVNGTTDGIAVSGGFPIGINAGQPPFSIEMWISNYNANGEGFSNFYSQTDVGAASTNGGLGIVQNVGQRLFFDKSPPVTSGLQSVATIGAGTYHVVYVESLAAPYRAWYINGVLDNFDTSPEVFTGGGNMTDVIIGNRPYFPFNHMVTIDEVAVYQHMLPPDRVLAHYNVGKI